MTALRENFNELLKEKDAFQISVLTVGALLLAQGAVSLSKSVVDGSFSKKFYELAYKAVQAAPGAVGAEAQKQRKEALESLAKEICKPDPDGVQSFDAVPANGLDYEVVLAQLEKLKARDESMQGNQLCSGCIYWGNKDHSAFLAKAQEIFLLANPLHPDVFPSMGKFEKEVVRMTKVMLGAKADDEVCGAVTSGGTESILMAMKTYRDQAKAEKGITNPELIIPNTAHAAFDKAGSYFGIKVIKIKVDEKTGTLTAKQYEKHITKNTIVLVGSAPSYPWGIIDPIEDIAELAKKHNIGMHVDACLGGFLLPWLVKNGVDLKQKFDFSVDGVTSMSADTHKYGYTSKGTSVVLYNSKQLRHHMYFVVTDWPGGVYASPSMSGSRPGALIAAAWASMVSLGESGYRKLAKEIQDTADSIRTAVKEGKCGDIQLCGDPLAMVLAFDSNTYDIQRWATGMGKRGWNLNRLHQPNAVHICFTAATAGSQDKFISDSKAVNDDVIADDTLYADGAAAVYGMAGQLPGALQNVLITDLVKDYLDVIV